MDETTKCDEVWPFGLRGGRIVECEKTAPHRKHENKDRGLKWWGYKLNLEEAAERDRIREMGGLDREKFKAWIGAL